VFVAKGHPHAHFQRAVERGNVVAAIAAAHQLGEMTLADALALCVLLAEKDPRRFDRAAVRWHGRYVMETQGVLLGESQLVLGALSGLTGPAAAAGAKALVQVARERRLFGFDSAVRRLLAWPGCQRSG
jgi:hypothetical protein